MAEEIAYKVSVDTGSGGKSLKDLKQDFKNAQQELSGLEIGTKAYIKQLEKLGGIRDNIGDLNASINAFNPEGKMKTFSGVVSGLASGFQAAQGAAALFGNESEEVQKALLKVQAVMAFSEGIKGVIAMEDKFKDLWLLIRANPFAAIIAAVTALAATAAVLYTQFSMTSQATKDLTNELETQHQTTELLSRTIKRQIDLLTAQGGSEREIIAVKEKLIQSQIMELETSLKLHQRKIEDVKDNDSLWESTLKLAGAIQSKMGNQAAADNFEKSIQLNKQERAKEDLEAIAKEKQDLLDLQNNIKVLSAEKINIDKKETEEYKKELDKRKEDRKKLTDYYKEIDAEIAAAKLEDATKAKTEEDLAAENAIAKNLKAMSDAKALSDYRIAEKEREEKDKQALEQQTFDQSVALAQQSTAAIGDLSNLLFDLKRRNMVKGSAQELKLAKRQFAIQKALAITNTVISTVQGMIKAIANNPPPSPIGIIGAALTGVAGTVATATIASKKFMGDGGGGDSGGGGAGSVSIPQPPTIAPPSQGNTDLNPDGTIKNKQSSQPVIKAFVVETDVTKTQKTVKQIEDKAKL